MYKIVFHYLAGAPDETYAGKTYVVQGERYAVLDDENPKLYKSEKVARNAAKKLMASCTNSGVAYSIEEVDTPVDGEGKPSCCPPNQERRVEREGKRKKCDQCGKRNALADTFIYEGEAYCMACLYSLVMAMAESGNLNLDFEDCEEHGVQVSF